LVFRIHGDGVFGQGRVLIVIVFGTSECAAGQGENYVVRTEEWLTVVSIARPKVHTFDKWKLEQGALLGKYVADVSRIKNHPDDTVRELVFDVDTVLCYTDEVLDVDGTWCRVVDMT
jgi:hypothetical protein